MRVLLDTHALLWFLAGDERLVGPARSLVADVSNEALVSVASLWEMAIKASLGKLDLPGGFEVLALRLDAERIRVLPIEVPHLEAVRRLPLYHRDPFDRLIAAQALAEGLPVVSADGALDAYGVRRLWAEGAA